MNFNTIPTRPCPVVRIAHHSSQPYSAAILSMFWLVLLQVTVAQAQTFQIPQTETEEKLLSRMLERRAFTPAEVAAIDQNGDSVIDVRDLVLYYKQFPKPAYAYFDAPSGTLKTWQGATNLLVRFSKAYIGTLNYQISGSAVLGRHFTLVTGQTNTSGVVLGSVAVNGPSVNIPIQVMDRQQFTGPATLVVALSGFRNVANQADRFALQIQTTANAEGVSLGSQVRQLSDLSVWRVINITNLNQAAGWQLMSTNSYDYGSASTHTATIVEADKGLYSGLLKFEDGTSLDPQPLRVAFRANGTAVFDVSQSPLLGPTNFSLPVTLPASGNPTFGGATTPLRQMPSTALGRTVSWTLRLVEPSASVAVVANETNRFALTNLSVGDLVSQQLPAPASMWRVADSRRLNNPLGWYPVNTTAWNLNALLTLNGVTGNPAGLALFGTLRLDTTQ